MAGPTSDEDWDDFEVIPQHDGQIELNCSTCGCQFAVGNVFGHVYIADLRNAAMEHNEESHDY